LKGDKGDTGAIPSFANYSLTTHTHTSFVNLALTGTLGVAGVSTLKNTNITGALEATSCITTKGTGFSNALIATNQKV
jgi:hypothetical protein